MARFFILVLTIILSSCQLSLDYEPSSIKELLPVGSRLTLNRAIDIPEDRSSIYIFRGKVTPYSQVDVYYPHCQFRLHKLSPKARRVESDTFRITRIVEWEDYTSRQSIRVAELSASSARITGGVSVGIGASDSGGPPLIKYATILSLQSDRQPEVRELVCLHWGDRGVIEPVTLQEMKSALGDLLSINE